jgi:hypothetical protein
MKIRKFLNLFLILLIIGSIAATQFPIYQNKNEDNFQDNESDELDFISSLKTSSNSNFSHYKIITIDHTKVSGSENLIDFPVLISILDSDLHDHTQLDGDDIAFSDGVNWLDHEIEVFNRDFSSTEAQLIAWVRIPSLSTSTDTKIFMYYGNSTIDSQENPEGVWNSNYMMVQHLKETSGTHYDSTKNNNDGTPDEEINQNSVGKIDGADLFHGLNENEIISVSHSNSLSISNCITLEAWINPTQLNDYQYFIDKRDSNSPSENYFLALWNNNSIRFELFGVNNNITYSTSEIFDVDQWYHIVATYDGTSKTIYINGTKDKEEAATGSILTNTHNLHIGTNWYPTYTFHGSIDEVRISNISRSADWIITEYNNQNDPDNFYSVEGTYKVSEHPPNVEIYSYYKEITIDHTKVTGSENLINFPVLINILDEELHDKTQTDGDDIAFGVDNLWLDHEIEFFNQTYSETQAKLVAWVRIPSLSPTVDTKIKIYYGNPTISSQENPSGLWNSNEYEFIHHLNNLEDSTSNNYDGTSHNNSILTKTGKINSAYNFDGDGDCINVSYNPLPSCKGMSFWLKYNYIPNNSPISNFSESGTYNKYARLYMGTKYGNLIYGMGTGYNDTFNPLNTDIWYYMVLSSNGTHAQGYLNGQLMTMAFNYTIESNNSGFSIGSLSHSTTLYTDFINGTMDEVRVLKVQRSQAWIATEYSNQNEPDSFYSVGIEYDLLEHPDNADYFTYYKEIIIDHTKVNGTENLINFPVLITILDSDLYDNSQTKWMGKLMGVFLLRKAMMETKCILM